MKKAKIFISMLLAGFLLLNQVPATFAAPNLSNAIFLAGKLDCVELETDTNTGVHTVLVTFIDDQGVKRTVRVSEETAYYDLHLLAYDDDGNPSIVVILPEFIEIDPAKVIPDEEEFHHPVALALATYFSEIDGLDYNTIMDAHTAGYGFGVIAQALWMIQKLDGDAADFSLLLQANKDGDYSDFPLVDGTIPTTWGELRKAISQNLGMTRSQRDREDNHNNNHANNGNENNRDKNNSNHGNGGNVNGNGHGNRP